MTVALFNYPGTRRTVEPSSSGSVVRLASKPSMDYPGEYWHVLYLTEGFYGEPLWVDPYWRAGSKDASTESYRSLKEAARTLGARFIEVLWEAPHQREPSEYFEGVPEVPLAGQILEVATKTIHRGSVITFQLQSLPEFTSSFGTDLELGGSLAGYSTVSLLQPYGLPYDGLDFGSRFDVAATRWRIVVDQGEDLRAWLSEH